MATAISVHLYPTGNQTLDTAGVPEVIEFDNEDFDVDAEWDTSTYKFTATAAGKYFITLQVAFGNADAGDRLLAYILKNAATTVAEGRMEALANAGGDFISVTTIEHLEIDDYIRAVAGNVDKSNELLTGTVDYLTYMMIMKM